MHAATTISEVVRLIAEVLRDRYALDPSPLIAAAGIDESRLDVSGSRVSRRAVMRLWELAEAATGDGAIGLEVGFRLRPTTYHAMGIAFISADTLLEGLELMCQYYRIVVTIPLELQLIDEDDDRVAFLVRYSDPHYPMLQIPFDSFIASIVALCRLATSRKFAPIEVRLEFADNGRAEAYRDHFGAPVVFGASDSALVLPRARLLEQLPGHSRDMFMAADGVLQNYLETLDPDEITARVRRELVRLLPQGRASQSEVSRRLNMSPSTVQRRLRAEKTTYRELLDSTQRALAIEYVRDRRLTFADIAFMLGFSDQSNFSRAFRRWTGMSPRAFRQKPTYGASIASNIPNSP